MVCTPYASNVWSAYHKAEQGELILRTGSIFRRSQQSAGHGGHRRISYAATDPTYNNNLYAP